MTDPHFYPCSAPLAVSAMTELVGGTFHGPESALLRQISAVGALTDAAEHVVACVWEKRYLSELGGCKAGVVITKAAWLADIPLDVPVILVDAPARALQKVAYHFFPDLRAPFKNMPVGTHPTAIVAPTASVHPTACIGAGAYIADHVVIGSCAVIGPGVVIGAESVIGPHVSIFYTRMGAGCTVLSGAQLGTTGFGFVPDAAGHQDIPQLGTLQMGADVWIGAGTTVARGALEDTIIGDGCRLDNLIQIAHNVVLGRGVVMAAQCGISGSTHVGDFTMMGGQVGLADHLTIGRQVQIAAQSGLMRSVEDGQKVGGTPAVSVARWMRQIALLNSLVDKRKTRGTE